MRARELFRAVKKDAEDIRLMTRLCEDPASVGKLLGPDLQALVCLCAVRDAETIAAATRVPYRKTKRLLEARRVALESYINLHAAVALYRKWAK